MKSCSALFASVLSAQLLSSLAAEVAELPEVKLTKIDPTYAKGALNRLIDNDTFLVIPNRQKAKAKPKRSSGKNRGRSLKKSKNAGATQQAAGGTALSSPQTGTATSHHGATTGRNGPPQETSRHHNDDDDYSMGDDTSYYYDDHYYDDGYYSGQGKGKGKGGKGGKGKGGSKGYYDE
jgi:hypothetical protein